MRNMPMPPGMDGVIPPLDRRRFVRSAASLAGATVLVGFVGTAAASATGGGTTIWRLESDWGFPVGPRGATSCGCSACRHHSANKIFLTRAAAETQRAHRGCRCIVVTEQIPWSEQELRSSSSDTVSLDRRQVRLPATTPSTVDPRRTLV